MAEVLVKKNSSLAFQGFYEFILPIVETHANVAASLAERKRCNHLIGFYRNINSKIDDNDCDGYRTLDSNLDQGEVQGEGSHRSERYKTTNEELGTWSLCFRKWEPKGVILAVSGHLSKPSP
ncbi:hypothetical protein SESBI_04515 [Sesbania bispinosa]|nr:hypothetical protein SESBI_04515 [Sesbania bispinosa]